MTTFDGFVYVAFTIRKDHISVNPKFQFFEIVEVLSSNHTEKLRIAGRFGAVLGIASSEEESEQTTYVLHIYDEENSFLVGENEIRATGRSAKRDDFYSGEVIRVTQAGELSTEQP